MWYVKIKKKIKAEQCPKIYLFLYGLVKFQNDLPETSHT